MYSVCVQCVFVCVCVCHESVSEKGRKAVKGREDALERERGEKQKKSI